MWEAKIEDASERGWCVYDDTGMLVARRLTKSNAKKIAAVPVMLTALANAEDWFSIWTVGAGEGCDCIPEIQAAIAKATG